MYCFYFPLETIKNAIGGICLAMKSIYLLVVLSAVDSVWEGGENNGE